MNNWIRKQIERLREWWKKQNHKPDPVDPVDPPTPPPDPPPPPPPDPPPIPTTEGVTIRGNRLYLDGAKWIPVADCSWWFLLGKLTDADRAWYLAERKTQGFNAIHVSTDGEEYRDRTKLDELVRLCRFAWSHGFVPFVGVGLHHYENSKPVRHTPAGRERETGRTFGRLLARYDGPMIWNVNGLDDGISEGFVKEVALGIRDVHSAPIAYHAHHGLFAVPKVGGAIATTQSGHKDLRRAFAASLVKECEPALLPVLALEPAFEQMPQYGNTSHIIDAADVANAIGGAVDAGAAGVGYGHHLVWGFSRGWQSAVENAKGASVPAKEAARIK